MVRCVSCQRRQSEALLHYYYIYTYPHDSQQLFVCFKLRMRCPLAQECTVSPQLHIRLIVAHARVAVVESTYLVAPRGAVDAVPNW
jgi:hypothetical protein